MAEASRVFPQHSGIISGILTAAGGLGGMILTLGMALFQIMSYYRWVYYFLA
ncbi:MAG: hypothetical protein ACUVQZ_02455 [Candidatus Caldatribacteriaceae bacterium]